MPEYKFSLEIEASYKSAISEWFEKKCKIAGEMALVKNRVSQTRESKRSSKTPEQEVMPRCSCCLLQLFFGAVVSGSYNDENCVTFELLKSCI